MLHVHTVARRFKKTHILPLSCKFSPGQNQTDLQSLLLSFPAEPGGVSAEHKGTDVEVQSHPHVALRIPANEL